MRSYPNKIAYKWVKCYDVMVVESSNVLIYKQEDGSLVDSCKKVVKYSNLFNAVCELHEMQVGNDHPKSKTLTGELLQSMERAFLGGSVKSFGSIVPTVSEQRQGKRPRQDINHCSQEG